MIDLWERAIKDIHNLQPKYVERKMENILSLLKKAKADDNFDICNANYCEKICSISRNIECRCAIHGRKLAQSILDLNIPFVSMKELKTLNEYNNVYIIGLSFDGCVLNRGLGYLNIDHPNKFVILDCCINENPLRGQVSNYYFSKNPNAFTISRNCPAKWMYRGKVQWKGPYYVFKSLEELHKYEKFIIQHYKLRTVKSTNILIKY